MQLSESLMPNKNYLSGRRLEWQVRKALEDQGYHAMRTAGSHGAFDIIGIRYLNKALQIKFIQCKVVKKLTEGVLNKLYNELINTSPIKEELDGSEIIVDVEIIIKDQCKSSYTVYPLESANG
jgi:hypothetical protein